MRRRIRSASAGLFLRQHPPPPHDEGPAGDGGCDDLSPVRVMAAAPLATRGAAVASESENEMTELDELADHLRTLRVDLVIRMAADLAAGEAVNSWLPVLTSIHTALAAVEAVMNEGHLAPERAPDVAKAGG